MANDRMAQIAADGMGGRMDLLEIPGPIPYPVGRCVLQDTTDTPVATKDKISTKEELYEELARMRQQYAPFLEDHAPGCSRASRSPG